MRQLFVATVAAVALACFGPNAARAGKVEVKNVHLCCRQCVTGAEGILAKVDGVSDVKADQKAKTVTFTAKDSAAAVKAVKALCEGGFYGSGTEDGKEIKVELPLPKAGEKANEVTIKNVHICCKQCQTTLEKVFSDAQVSFASKTEMKVSGKDLDKAKLIETLRKAGFNGTVDK